MIITIIIKNIIIIIINKIINDPVSEISVILRIKLDKIHRCDKNDFIRMKTLLPKCKILFLTNPIAIEKYIFSHWRS